MNQQKSTTQRRNEWLQTIVNPFTHPSCHIPDDRTSVSGTVSARETFAFVPTALSGTSNTHAGGFYFFPVLNGYRSEFNEITAAGGNFSSLNGVNGQSGVVTHQNNVPNSASLNPDGCTARLVSLGVRVTYEGTELNRSGKIFAGTVGINSAAIAAPAISGGAYTIDPLTVLTGRFAPNSSVIKSVFNNTVTSRVSDSALEVNWIPNGCPSYQTAPNTLSGLEPTSSLVASSILPSSAWNTSQGAAGAQAGQNVLLFLIEGDTTATATATGNTYSIEVISHWEVIPLNPLTVAYDLTQSLHDTLAIQSALNHMGVMARYKRLGLTGNQGNSKSLDFQSGVSPPVGRSVQVPRRNKKLKKA